MDWKERAILILKDSLYPVPTELNELDWKSGLSEKTDRLAQHISAFANLKGGGILVFGVHNDGTCFNITKEEVDKTVQTLGNIALNNLVYPIKIDHSMFPPKGLKDMTKQEKISACYQHACLMYEDGEAVNNQSVRERFELNKNDSSIASRIISDTVEA